MGIASILKQRSYKKKLNDWPTKPGCAIEIALDPPMVNNLRFRSHIDEARSLGRPNSVTVFDAGTSVRLDFPHQGVTLEYEHDSLVYLGIVLSPNDDISSQATMAPARATLLHGGRAPLASETTANDIIGVLGPPTGDDTDDVDAERVLTHHVKEYTVESEFTPEDRLKRVNVYPT